MRTHNRQSLSAEQPHLPTLDSGITLLEHPSAIETVVHALAVDHLLRSGGDAV